MVRVLVGFIAPFSDAAGILEGALKLLGGVPSPPLARIIELQDILKTDAHRATAVSRRSLYNRRRPESAVTSAEESS